MNSFEKQSPATSKGSLHGILATISSKKWPHKAIDLKTSFLQGDEKLTRKVYLTPTSEAHISHSHVWLLKKYVYSLTDTSLMWYEKVQKFVTDNEGKISVADPALFMWHENKNLIGVICVHVDDFLNFSSII